MVFLVFFFTEYTYKKFVAIFPYDFFLSVFASSSSTSSKHCVWHTKKIVRSYDDDDDDGWVCCVRAYAYLYGCAHSFESPYTQRNELVKTSNKIHTDTEIAQWRWSVCMCGWFLLVFACVFWTIWYWAMRIGHNDGVKKSANCLWQDKLRRNRILVCNSISIVSPLNKVILLHFQELWKK